MAWHVVPRSGQGREKIKFGPKSHIWNHFTENIISVWHTNFVYSSTHVPADIT